MDIVFAFGFEQPTICVLYKEEFSHSIKTYEVPLNEGNIVECLWSLQNLSDDTCCLIPIPSPYNGLLIIGGNEIMYSKGSTNTSTLVETLLDTYGRGVDAKEYLLGGGGLLNFLTFAHENDNVTGLKIERVAKTSVASTLSYIDNGLVYFGSFSGYSQLIKFNREPHKGGYFDVEVLKRYINLGPINDICMTDESETHGQGQLVACSGVCQDGSLHIIIHLQM